MQQSNLKRSDFIFKKNFKISAGVLLSLIGFIYLFFDSFTYFPYVLILSGIAAVILSFTRLNNKLFYILLFFLYYLPFSVQHEVYKRYKFKIQLPNNQNRIYFIASNTSLEWKDYLLTWFSSKNIQVDLNEKTIVYLQRKIPNHVFFNYREVYNKGYSISIAYGEKGNYKYIVLMPLNNKRTNLSNENFSDSHYGVLNNIDAELNKTIIKHKIDSLEKYGLN